jgi:Fe-Mn family superoxide dismutase
MVRAAPLADTITGHFGSFESFSKRLSAAAAGVQGSRVGRAGVRAGVWAADHRAVVRPPPQRGRRVYPAAGLRRVEHAYYLQYRNVRPDYVTRLRDLVNWADVNARYQAARAAGKTSRREAHRRRLPGRRRVIETV